MNIKALPEEWYEAVYALNLTELRELRLKIYRRYKTLIDNKLGVAEYIYTRLKSIKSYWQSIEEINYVAREFLDKTRYYEEENQKDILRSLITIIPTKSHGYLSKPIRSFFEGFTGDEDLINLNPFKSYVKFIWDIDGKNNYNLIYLIHWDEGDIYSNPIFPTIINYVDSIRWDTFRLKCRGGALYHRYRSKANNPLLKEISHVKGHFEFSYSRMRIGQIDMPYTIIDTD